MKYIISVLFFLLLLNKMHAQNEDINLLREQVKKAKTGLERFDNIRRQCIYYHQNGIIDSLSSYSKEMLAIAQKEKNDSLLSLSYGWIANYFDDVGDFANALEFNFKALQVAEKIRDTERIGVLHNNISWAYIQLGNFSAGAEYGKKSAAILLSIRDKLIYKIGLPLAYDDVAQSYLGLKQADSALQYTQLANAANLKLGNHYVQSWILCEFARTYDLLNDKKMAETYYQTTISYADSFRILQPLGVASTQYSKFLFTQKRFTEARQYGLIGLKASTDGGFKRQLIDNAESLRLIHEQLNNKDSAYYYAKLVIAYRDTVFSEQKNIQVQNLMFAQQVHKQEEEQEQLKIRQERMNNIQYAVIALGLLIFIILFFLLSHSIVANERLIKFLGILSLLIVFEFINLLIHPYLSNITNHSALLMLVIMVCIAALLIPLHHKLEKWIIIRMVEKNKKIRLVSAKKTIQQLDTIPDNKSD